MKLYDLTLGTPELRDEIGTPLFFSGSAVLSENELLTVPKGGKLSFGTYYNSFSYPKYLRYTSVRKISVKLFVSGQFSFTVKRINESGTEAELFSAEYDFTEKSCAEAEIDFGGFEDDNGLLYPEITAVTDCVFYGGHYSADDHCAVNKIKLAAAICTFKRESYVYGNMKRLSKYDLGGIADKFSVIISDNGHTLDSSLMPKNIDISVVENPNFGGSGGFTRGITEAYRQGCFTHILLMDDDVRFDCQSIYRTVTFLECAEDPDIWLGGNMIAVERPTIMFESGALWNDGASILKNGLDLCSKSDLCRMNREEHPDYCGWWYLCFPSTALKNGLPIPFFIKFDDVEFSLRNKPEIVMQNGISVHHDSFDSKYSFYLNYYYKRNELVSNALHQKNSMKCAFKLLTRSLAKIMVTYEYFTLDLVKKAFDDFFQGVDFFKHTNEEELNNKLRSTQPKMLSKSELNDQGYYFDGDLLKKSHERKINRLLSAVTFNGYLIPKAFYKKEYGQANINCCQLKDFFMRKEVLLYNPVSECGIVTEIKKGQLFRIAGAFISYSFKLLLKYGKAKKNFREHIGEITSPEFWEEHLSL